MQKLKLFLFFISLTGALLFGFRWQGSPQFVLGQSYSGADVVWAMNDIRAVFGLEAYVIRDDLMQLAQSHAEYMAENEVLTHTRADGSQPNVTAENVSLGPIQIAINTWMDDQPHKDTILAWSKGWAGAGVALSDNGYIYISFDMIRMPDGKYVQIFDPYPPFATEDPSLPTLAPGEATRTPVPGISQIINEVVASTPDAEGFIWHEVKNGQTLWAIATGYGVSEERIAGLNSININNPTIYKGQKLLIDMVTPPAPTKAMTETLQPSTTPVPSLTPTKTLPTYTLTPVSLPLQTTEELQVEEIEKNGNKGWLIGGGVLVSIGLGYAALKKFWFKTELR